jgi:hypothetical protein
MILRHKLIEPKSGRIPLASEVRSALRSGSEFHTQIAVATGTFLVLLDGGHHQFVLPLWEAVLAFWGDLPKESQKRLALQAHGMAGSATYLFCGGELMLPTDLSPFVQRVLSFALFESEFVIKRVIRCCGTTNCDDVLVEYVRGRFRELPEDSPCLQPYPALNFVHSFMFDSANFVPSLKIVDALAVFRLLGVLTEPRFLLRMLGTFSERWPFTRLFGIDASFAEMLKKIDFANFSASSLSDSTYCRLAQLAITSRAKKFAEELLWQLLVFMDNDDAWRQFLSVLHSKVNGGFWGTARSPIWSWISRTVFRRKMPPLVQLAYRVYWTSRMSRTKFNELYAELLRPIRRGLKIAKFVDSLASDDQQPAED